MSESPTDFTPPQTAVGAVGIVRREDAILLVLSRDRGWEPPGGYCDDGEFVIDALRREVLEETGYVVAPRRLTGIYQCIRERPILSFVFLCDPEEKTARPIAESLALRWCPIESLAATLTYPPHALRVTDALEPRDGVRLTSYTIDPFSVDRKQHV